MRRVPADRSDLTPRAIRALVEDEFGARLEGWIRRAGVSVTDVADALGLQRPHLYDYMRGERSWKAAWLALLPAAVLREALAELAGSIGFELRPRAELDAEHDHARGGTALVQRACDAIRQVAETQADGRIDRAEALAELELFEDLERQISERKIVLRQAVAEGVIPLRKGHGG